MPARTNLLAAATLLCCGAALTTVAGPSRFRLFSAAGTIPPESIQAFTKDQHGLLWVAATDGIYRFDGFHIHKHPGYPFPTARFLAASGSRLWAGGSQGLASFSGSNWKVELQGESIEGMTSAPAEDTLWIYTKNSGLQRIRNGGAERKRLQVPQPTGALVVDTHNALWFPCGAKVCTVHPGDLRLETTPIPIPGNWRKVAPALDGTTIWIGSTDSIAKIEGGKATQQAMGPGYLQANATSESLDPILTPSGNVWAHRVPELRNHYEPYVKGDACSWFADVRSRWFCSGSSIAVSEVQEPDDWFTWYGGIFQSVSMNGIAPGGPFLTTDSGILKLDADGMAWSRVSEGTPIFRMSEDGHGGYWIATREEGMARMDAHFAITERFPKLCASPDTFRALFRDGSNRMWIGGKDRNCFFEVTGEPGKWQFHPQTLPGQNVMTVAAHADSKGRPWVGYEEGLAYLDGSGAWKKIQTSEPLDLVREFAFDGDDVIWVSRRRNGYFLRLERRGDVWQVRRFPADKYGPEDTYDLRVDSRGWVWRGTNSGVLVARPGRYAPSDWLLIDRNRGLASVGVHLGGWMEDKAGYVWMTGERGVTRVKPPDEWFATPAQDKAPLIARVKAGKDVWLDPGQLPAAFRSGAAETLEVDFGGLDGPVFRRAQVQYRLLPRDAEWTEAEDASAKWSGLADGAYTLEVAYTGDGNPRVTRWDFRVGREWLPASWWGGGIGLVALLAVGAGWHRREWLGYWSAKLSYVLFHRSPEALEALPAASLQQGTLQAGRYRLDEQLSTGGSAVTYRARDLMKDRDVAVKVLTRAAGEESEMRHRFAQEVAALVAMDHPGVVRLLDSWIATDGAPCIAMEFLNGLTLRKVLQSEGPLPRERAAAIITAIGDAMGAVHARGIVHRDLKPENILLTNPRKTGSAGSVSDRLMDRDADLFALPSNPRKTGSAASTSDGERPVIIDFGTSAARGAEGELERTSSLSGSLAYLAPERLGGRYSTASDIYSLGVMVLEMLTGKRPPDYLSAPNEPKFLEEISDSMPRAAAQRIVEALEHNPLRRPADVATWMREIAASLVSGADGFPDAGPSN